MFMMMDPRHDTCMIKKCIKYFNDNLLAPKPEKTDALWETRNGKTEYAVF